MSNANATVPTTQKASDTAIAVDFSESSHLTDKLFSPVLDAPFYWAIVSHPKAVEAQSGAHGDDHDANSVRLDSRRNDEDEDVIGAMHPVFAIPWGTAEKARRYFENKVRF